MICCSKDIEDSARDNSPLCGLPTKSSNSQPTWCLRIFALLAGALVRATRRPIRKQTRRGLAIDLSPVPFSLATTTTNNSSCARRQQHSAIETPSDVVAEGKRNSRRSPLASFSLTYSGVPASAKAAPPTASALQSLNPRQTTTKPPSLAHLHHHTTTSRHSQPCFSVSSRYCCFKTRHTPLPHRDSRHLPRPSTASLLTAAPGLVFFLDNNPSLTHLDSIPAQHGRQPGSRWHSLAWYVFSSLAFSMRPVTMMETAR